MRFSSPPNVRQPRSDTIRRDVRRSCLISLLLHHKKLILEFLSHTCLRPLNRLPQLTSQLALLANIQDVSLSPFHAPPFSLTTHFDL